MKSEALSKTGICVFWHRRDLRTTDNAGLYQALKHEKNVQPLFIFDRNILDGLDKKDARVEFILKAVAELDQHYRQQGSSLRVFDDTPLQVFKKLQEKNIPFKGFKDQVIFEKNEVVKNDASPYTIFTPYSKKWKEKCNDFYLESYPVEKALSGK